MNGQFPGWAAGLILLPIGLLMVAGGLSHWGWWWNNRRARALSAVISQTGARIFYVGFGAVILLAGALFLFGIIEPPRK